MTTIAPMSSTIASVSSSTLTPAGTRAPSSATTPRANAMSVAIGMPHPSGPGAAGVEGEEDAGRHDHPAERGDRRQGDRPAVAELADDQLALDLHPDDEEEHRHQQVVDEVAEVLLEPSRNRRRRGWRCATATRSWPTTASWPRPGPRRWRRRARCRRPPRRAGTGRAVGRRGPARRSLCRNVGRALGSGAQARGDLLGVGG